MVAQWFHQKDLTADQYQLNSWQKFKFWDQSSRIIIRVLQLQDYLTYWIKEYWNVPLYFWDNYQKLSELYHNYLQNNYYFKHLTNLSWI